MNKEIGKAFMAYQKKIMKAHTDAEKKIAGDKLKDSLSKLKIAQDKINDMLKTVGITAEDE